MQTTLGKFIDAMELNGYDQSFGSMLDEVEDGNTIYAACALGQAFLNLNARIESARLIDIKNGRGENFYSFVTDKNDNLRSSIKEIARLARIEFVESLDIKLWFDEAYYDERFDNYQGKRV